MTDIVDMFGKELAVGDRVIYALATGQSNASLLLGEILKINPASKYLTVRKLNKDGSYYEPQSSRNKATITIMWHTSKLYKIS